MPQVKLQAINPRGIHIGDIIDGQTVIARPVVKTRYAYVTTDGGELKLPLDVAVAVGREVPTDDERRSYARQWVSETLVRNTEEARQDWARALDATSSLKFPGYLTSFKVEALIVRSVTAAFYLDAKLRLDPELGLDPFDVAVELHDNALRELVMSTRSLNNRSTSDVANVMERTRIEVLSRFVDAFGSMIDLAVGR